MPDEQKLDPTHREGAYRSRVIIGGSYSHEMRSRLEDIKLAVRQAGFHPVVADEVGLENVDDIHRETMVLLHSCRLAIFEVSIPSGALMEIERLPDYGTRTFILYADPDNKGWLVSQMLSTFARQHEAYIKVESYLNMDTAIQHAREWLEKMKQEGFH